MKNKEKFYSITLVTMMMVLFIILASSTACAFSGKSHENIISAPSITSGSGNFTDDQILVSGASTVQSATGTESTIQGTVPSIFETRITTNLSDSALPVIYGNRIAWEDDRNGNWDVYIYDLSTKKEPHTTDKSNQYAPDIYGNRVVWTDERNGNGDIYLQDLSTSTQTRITTNTAWQWGPAIYGDKIVWTDERNVNGDIYMYDLYTKKERRITTNTAWQWDPAIYGNKIVWTDERNGNLDIYMYDLSTSKERRITTNASDQYAPAIYGNRIVWMDGRNGGGFDEDYMPVGNWDIYMYDLSTSKEKRITTNPSCSAEPAIYGNLIVWADDRNGNWDIYLYDLGTYHESHTTDGSDQYFPDIYGNRIVWTDWRNGDTADIYMGTLGPHADFSAYPRSGYSPLKVTFTDKSTSSPTSWKWSFGDGTYSTTKNPVHTYGKAGKYTVSLTVKNSSGSSTETKYQYIVLTK